MAGILFNGSKSIKVEEYTKASITTKGATAIFHSNTHADFNFSGWELADAIARTICSRHLNDPEYWGDFIASLLSLNSIIDRIEPNVRLKQSRLLYLRDFSKTTRIGEIAQGLTHLYLRKKEGYPFINDYEHFCSLSGISIPHKSSTPDFVAQKKELEANVCLAESKGTLSESSKSIKTKLAKAMSQCVSGENILHSQSTFKVIQKLGFCFELSNEKEQLNSRLHFVDPEEPPENKATSSFPLRMHYATWLYMVGQFDNVERLLKEQPIKWDESYFRILKIEDESYWVLDRIPKSLIKYFSRSIPFVELLELYPFFPFGDRTLGISQKVVNMLQKNDFNKFKGFTFQNTSNEEFEQFSDGTILIKRRYEQ